MIPASDQYPIFQWLTYYGYSLLHVTTCYYLLLLSSDDPMGYSSYNYGYPLLISVIWRTPTRTGLEFAFPQSNGDVFAFTEPVNSAFQHCVPRGDRRSRPRISVILCGLLVEGGAGLLRCSAEVRWAMGKTRFLVSNWGFVTPYIPICLSIY